MYVKSRISERLKIQVIEKSKSDSDSHRKRADPAIQVIPGTEESEHGTADQLCLGNEDTKIEEDILRTTKEPNERKMISTENTEDESGGSELNDPVKYTYYNYNNTIILLCLIILFCCRKLYNQAQ